MFRILIVVKNVLKGKLSRERRYNLYNKSQQKRKAKKFLVIYIVIAILFIVFINIYQIYSSIDISKYSQIQAERLSTTISEKQKEDETITEIWNFKVKG